MLANRLQFSLSRANQLFDNSRVAWKTVVVLLVVHSGLLMYSAYVHSPTRNEPAYLYSGVSHWHYGSYSLCRVNPPLVRLIAALPALPLVSRPEDSSALCGPGMRPESSLARSFFADYEGDFYTLITISRTCCIPFSIIGALTCFFFAQSLHGTRAGYAACIMWCICPHILAHGALITPDVPAAALAVLASYAFHEWLRCPSWLNTAVAAIVLGIAELTKATLLLLYPAFAVALIAHLISRQNCRSKLITRFSVIIAASLLTFNTGYGFKGTLTPIESHHFVSELFRSFTSATSETSGSGTDQGNSSLLGGLPIPVPADYLAGLDIQQRDFESFHTPSYLCGSIKETGWWYYYLYAFLIRTPLGTLALLALRLSQSHKPITSYTYYTSVPLMGLLIVVVSSIKFGFSEHYRYIIPALPYLYIFISPAFCDPYTATDNKAHTNATKLTAALPWALLLASALSTLWSYPHNLNYFNEAIGGPKCGRWHLLGSNIDWGQDDRYVESLANRTCVSSFVKWHGPARVSHRPLPFGIMPLNEIVADGDCLSVYINDFATRHIAESEVRQFVPVTYSYAADVWSGVSASQ